MRSTYAIAAAIALAACGQPQIARPVSAPSAPQPTTAAPQNATSSARPWGPSEEEMSRTRGPGWILARTPGRDRMYLHQTTMARQGDVVQTWILINAWEPITRPSGFFVRSSTILFQFDCNRRLVRLLDFNLYSDRGASGDVRSEFVAAMAVWRPIEPGSIDEGLMNAACQRRPQAPPASEPTGRPSQPPSSLGPVKDPV